MTVLSPSPNNLYSPNRPLHPLFSREEFAADMSVFFTASYCTSITSHIHNWVLFCFWLSLFVLSGVTSPLFSSSILGTYCPGEFLFQCPIFLLFHTVRGVLKVRIRSGLQFPSPMDHILSELSTMTHPPWVALPNTAHSFTELDKAMVHVIRLASCLWLWFQSVCPLMPSLSAYHLWVSLTLDVWYLFMAASAKCSRCSLPWIF